MTMKRTFIIGALLALTLAPPVLAQVVSRDDTTNVPGVIVVTTVDGKRVVAPTMTIVAQGSLATAQVSVGTTATLVAAARPGRQRIILSVGAANTCAFGNAGVTLATGFPLQPTAGASLTLDTAAAVYAVCSATTTINDIEQF